MQTPHFLSLKQVKAIHERSLKAHGGLSGLRDSDGLQSAIGQPQNVFHYLAADLHEMAAAYAFHLAEAQAFLDGNKRTAIASALIFLEINNISTTAISPMDLYEPMIQISAGKLSREGLAQILRTLLPQE